MIGKHLDVVYEAEQIRQWIEELSRKADRLLAREGEDAKILSESFDELQELRSTCGALRQALAVLSCLPDLEKRLDKRLMNGHKKPKPRRMTSGVHPGQKESGPSKPTGGSESA